MQNSRDVLKTLIRDLRMPTDKASEARCIVNQQKYVGVLNNLTHCWSIPVNGFGLSISNDF